jgi:Probable zinc-ribbon domain
MAKQRRRLPRYRRQAEKQERAVGQWDPRFCTKEIYDHMMAQMPKGAIPADMTKHAAHNSYSPLFWYRDCEFVCKDCGGSELWTAEAQRWWYEEAKGPIHSRAVRCRACREARRASHGGTPRRSHADRKQTGDAEHGAGPDPGGS